MSEPLSSDRYLDLGVIGRGYLARMLESLITQMAGPGRTTACLTG